MKTQPVPAEDIERWKLELGLIKMEAGDLLPLDMAITPVTDPADRLYFQLDNGTVVWLGPDGSAVSDHRRGSREPGGGGDLRQQVILIRMLDVSWRIPFGSRG
ncbi:MAG: hypothetical protein M3P18_20210 [Actinomycetota bacterium]|nr:hypothetical protein [Actinomycetota bacterium]